MSTFLSLPIWQRALLALGTAAAISFAATPGVKWLAVKVGAVDVPKDDRRMHDHPIPRMGGLAIAVAFGVCVALYGSIDEQLRGMLLGAAIILAVGMVDDRNALPALPKLFAQIAAGTIVAMHGCTVRYLTNPFSPEPFDLGLLAGPVTVFWIVLMTNAVNFIDGLDGLAVGVSAISTGFMLIIAWLLEEFEVAVILAALLGACLGFLPFNFNPAKIFMGDTGSTFLGFVLAVLSVRGLFKLYTTISFMIPFLILGVPFFDITFAVVRRLWRRQNPMTADRGHLHHRLIDMGLGQKRSVVIVYMLTGVLGVAAVLLTNAGGARAFILLAAVLVVALLSFVTIIGPSHRPRKDEEKHG